MTVAVLLLFSCSDEESQSFNDSFLTAGAWWIESLTSDIPIDYKGDGHKSTDLLSQWGDCAKDDSVIFKADHTLVENDGANLCEGETEGDYEVGTWKIEAGTQKGGFLIIQQEGEDPTTWSVQLVGKDEMRIIFQESEFTDQVYKMTYVCVRTKSPR